MAKGQLKLFFNNGPDHYLTIIWLNVIFIPMMFYYRVNK